MILTTPFLLFQTSESNILLIARAQPPAQSKIKTRAGAINTINIKLLQWHNNTHHRGSQGTYYSFSFYHNSTACRLR